MPPKNNKGFTFIEMCIALILISILSVISLQSLNILQRRVASWRTQEMLIEALQYAESESVARRVPISICKSNDKKNCGGEWQQGLIIFIDHRKLGVIDRPKDYLISMKGAKKAGQLRFRAFPYYRDYLLFMPQGVERINNGQFWYCEPQNKNPEWAMVMNRKLKITVKYPDKRGEIVDSHGKRLIC